jgi:tRNA (Thr-GGU) A37 N-methylase
MKIHDEIIYKPIGIIHSPFKEAKVTPIQPTAAKGVDGPFPFIRESNIKNKTIYG